MKKIGLFGLYNLLSLLLLPFFALFILGTWFFKPVYRAHLAQRFACYPADLFRALHDKQVIWVHAASVGEVMMSRLFVQGLKAHDSHIGIVVSTITPTGQAAAREHLADFADVFIYFPFDFFWVIPSAMRKISPALFIFMETEIWPNCLRNLAARRIPAVMANGRISVKSFPSYKRFRSFLVSAFEGVSLFLMQSAQDVDRIVALGASARKVVKCGNMKYDQAAFGAAPQAQQTLKREDLGLTEDTTLMIAGSTRPGEEEAVLEAYQILLAADAKLSLLIAPRHLDRLALVEKQVLGRGYEVIRKSRISDAGLEDRPKLEDRLKNRPVILLDTLGELNRFYALGVYIFVGGSLADFGGHNPLEAAAHQKPVFFGPHMKNFKDISEELLRAGGAIQVNDGKELGEAMLQLSQNPEDYRRRALAAHDVVLKHRGAVEAHLRRITPLLSQT